MKLLLTGAFSYTAKQIKELEEIAGEVIYIKDERSTITTDVSDIDIVVCNGLFLYNPIEKFKNLKLIQLTSAGFDRIPMDYIKSANIQVENAKGVYSIPMAEWVILMILQFYKKSKAFHRFQMNHEWIKQRDLLELSGKTVIIVGFGNVGREIAKRLCSFDATIIGIDVTDAETKLADEFYTYDRFDDVLDRADILVLSLPLTKDTYHFINRERLSKLKSSCIVINVSRGSLIDENALIDALQNNQIHGAALDVFEEEPLSPESPLWDFENVYITPHNSFVSDQIADRLYTLIKNNICNFIKQQKDTKRYRYCIVTTMSSSIDYWIKPFLPLYHKHGFDVTVICNMTPEYQQELRKSHPYVKAIPVPMPRGIDVFGSIKAIFHLYKALKKGNFHMVQYSTPNASFYTAIASFLARIPIRLYCQWGMVFVTMKGLKRFIFQMMERLVCLLSTQVQPDSYGNLIYCRKRGFYSKKKSHVIWNGSAKGVDLDKFDISKKEIYRKQIRKKYGIREESIVLGFVGRLGKEKGCVELFEGFRFLEAKYPNLHLLFVGPLEKEDTIDPSLLDWFYQNNRIIRTGRVLDVEKHMAAMDIFILPSYREGFGMSVVEAEAMEVPVIVTDIPGPANGMIAGVTGITIPVKDTDALVQAVEELLNDEEKRKAFGKAGYEFVRSHFDSKIFARKLLKNRIQIVKGYKKKMRVLITGSGSYVGRNLKYWLENTGEFIVDELDMENPEWIHYDFTPYDTVIHVAAIVHKKNKIPWSVYYNVNAVLPYKVAKKAKESHVEQFIFFSTMAVYGEGKKLPEGNIIDEKAQLNPKSYYGKSKLAAEKKLLKLDSQSFKVSIVRPPNIYGYGCPGNYMQSFIKLARITPVIPVIYTECRQGFIYIDNLCNFIYQLIKDRRPGIFHPQDGEGISTFTLLSEIAGILHKKRIWYSQSLGKIISCFHRLQVVIKIFGGVSYSTNLSMKPYNNYSRVDFKDALKNTLFGPTNDTSK